VLKVVLPGVNVKVHVRKVFGISEELRLLSQLHVCLLWCPAAFLLIAAKAGKNHVVPRDYSALTLGNNVVKGAFCFRKILSAVLAATLIPDVNMLSVTRKVSTLLNYLIENHNSGKSKGEVRRTYGLFVSFQNRRLSHHR